MIVARYPQALPVLQRLGLDTCCGGSLPLRTAAQHHDLDPQAVLAALQKSGEPYRYVDLRRPGSPLYR